MRNFWRIFALCVLMILLLCAMTACSCNEEPDEPNNTPVTFEVTFVASDGTVLKKEEVEHGSAAIPPADEDIPQRTGHEFIGWDKDFSEIDCPITVTAQYVRVWSVVFDSDGGTTIPTQTIRNGETATQPTAPTLDNYIFAGWTYGSAVYDFTTPVTEDITLVAIYTPITPVPATYTVTFDTRGGGDIPSQTIESGETTTRPADPEKANHAFDCWMLNGAAYDFTPPVTASITLVANYTEDVKYAVTFKDHDGTIISTDTVYVGEEATAPADPTRVGYVFQGWDKTFNNVTSDMEVTATYEVVQYHVSFNTQGGGDIPTQTVAHGDNATKPSDPTREGFDFVKWQVNGVDYDFTTPVTGDITVVAIYKSNGVVPEATNTTLVLDPNNLEVWTDMSLRLNIKPSSTNKIFIDNTNATFQFISTDPSIMTVANDGTFTTYDKVGPVKIYAIATKGGSLVADGTTFTVTEGDILGAIDISVVEQPAYYKAYLEDSDNQKITLGSTSSARIDKNDYLSYPAGDYGDANISLWYNDTVGVFTMTVDDNPNVAQQAATWETWRQTYGIPATFIVWSGAVNTTEGTLWQQLNTMGNSVQTHGANHQQVTSDITDARIWYDLYYGQKQVGETSGSPSLIVGYANGTNMEAISSLLFIGGRGTKGDGNSVSLINYNQTNSYSGFPATDMSATLESLLGEDGSNGWISVHFHAIGSYTETVTSNYALMQTYVEDGKLWAPLFYEASQYGQERDTATVIVHEAGANIIRLSVTDEMNDILFYHPLSVRVKVDSTWTGVRAYQNGKEVSARVIEKGGETYVMTDAVPDQGEVTLVRTNLGTVNQTASAITFTPTDAGGFANTTMTYTFAVSDDAWNYIYATQGGVKIPATTETTAGITTLSVTFEVNGGVVSVLPLTDQLDGRTSYTMTEIYNREAAPDPTKVITISTAEELVYLSEFVRRGNALEGCTVRLTNDINMKNVEIAPIGFVAFYTGSSGHDRYVPFSGTFDGAGYTISNLTITRCEGQTGLFGYTKNAVIRNLAVEGKITGVARVGGIVGSMGNTVISNCNFTGTVTNHAVLNNKDSGCHTGGLIGYMGSGTIEHSTFSGTVLATATVTKGSATNNTGGLVGTMHLGAINNCYIEATVTSESVDEDSGNYVGGILGLPTGTDTGAKSIKNCTAKVNVTGNTCVGGLVGAFSSGSSSRPISLNNNAVIGTVNGNEYVGGLAGKASEGGAGVLSVCFAAVTVNAPDTAQYVGTLVGGRNAQSYGACIYNNHYISTLNPNMLAYVVAGGEANTGHINTEHTNAADALDDLNTKASNNAASGFYAWRMTDGYPCPTYEDVFTVTFLGKNGEVLKSEVVVGGMDATAPTAPVILGYEFTGWDKTFTNVIADIIVQAQYEEVVTHTVTFLGKDGEGTLKTEVVNDGLAATAPTAPTIEGYRFTGWSTTFDAITDDLVVDAQYVKTWTVTYLKKDGTVYKTETYDEGTVPTMPTGPLTTGYSFLRWNPETLPALYADVTVSPVYEVKATSAVDYTVMHWSIADNAMNGNVGLTAAVSAGRIVEALTAAGNPDIFILSGMKSGYLPKGTLSKAGYTYFNEAKSDSTHVLFYNAAKFSVGGTATYASLAGGKITYTIFPLQNAEGMIIPVVSVRISVTAATSDTTELFASLSTALGETADCAIIRAEVVRSAAANTSEWQTALTTTADAYGKAYTASAGVNITKGGTLPTGDQNLRYSFLITYTGGNPTMSFAGETMVTDTDNTSYYPNSNTAGSQPAYNCTAYVATVSIGAYAVEG